MREALLAVLRSVAESEAIAGRTHRLSGKKLSLSQRGQRASSKTVSQSRQSRALCKGIDIETSRLSHRNYITLYPYLQEAGAQVIGSPL